MRKRAFLGLALAGLAFGVTMKGTGVTEVLLKDPDVGGFVLLFESPAPAK